MKPEKPCVLAIVLLAGLLTGSPIFSEAQSTTEPIMIKILLTDATSYQGHDIAVVGIAKDVEERLPVPACKHMLRYGDYVFDLKDESGSIRVEVMGTCGNQGGLKIARDGDRVLVKGVFIQLLSGNLSSPTTFISALNQAVSRLPQ
ncbi:MAG: hypothetical protein EWM73_02138 [Nitrospira sp.]|nr:MAG: hypothetical protein EWM73_02138 [Nitrospira sp.]